MRTVPGVLAAALIATATLGAQPAARARGATPYVPGAQWERREPAAMGFDAARLAEAIEFAKTNDARAPRDMEESHYRSFGREPFGDGIGPFKPRGEPSGVVVRGGYVVASWVCIDSLANLRSLALASASAWAFSSDRRRAPQISISQLALPPAW